MPARKFRASLSHRVGCRARAAEPGAGRHPRSTRGALLSGRRVSDRSPARRPPFPAAGRAVSLDVGTVDRGSADDTAAAGHRGEHRQPNALPAPLVAAVIDRRIRLVTGRAVTPARTGAQHMHDAADRPSVVDPMLPTDMLNWTLFDIENGTTVIALLPQARCRMAVQVVHRRDPRAREATAMCLKARRVGGICATRLGKPPVPPRSRPRGLSEARSGAFHAAGSCRHEW
jgi:hypothetical protein